MSEQNINRLCAFCANQCKQNATVKIVDCPQFLRVPDEREFRRMIDDLSTIEEQARTLQKRARTLINEALKKSGGTPETLSPSPAD